MCLYEFGTEMKECISSTHRIEKSCGTCWSPLFWSRIEVRIPTANVAALRFGLEQDPEGGKQCAAPAFCTAAGLSGRPIRRIAIVVRSAISSRAVRCALWACAVGRQALIASYKEDQFEG